MTTRLFRFAPLAVLAALAAGTASTQSSAGDYRVLRRTVLGGEGGWDYLTADAPSHRLFVSRGTHVMVVDTRTDSVVGEIPGTPGVHGIALAPELGRGFTSNGRDSTVTVFDLKTLAPLGTTHVTGRGPDAIAYEPVSKRVFTFNGGSGSATAVDAATGRVVGTLDLGGRPESAVSDGAGRMFVNLEDRSEIVPFDARTLRAGPHWALAGCEEPSGLAIDRAHHRLFAVCSNGKMAVVDAASGRVVATVPIGEGPDAAAFDPATQTVFSSNGEGTLTVVHEDTPDRYRVVQTLATQRSARTMALDPGTHRLYLVTAEFGPAPAATADTPRPRRPMIPGSFVLLTVGR